MLAFRFLATGSAPTLLLWTTTSNASATAPPRLPSTQVSGKVVAQGPSSIIPGSGQLESRCTCCQPVGQKVLSVPVSCTDGHRRVVSLPVPSACSCEACLHQPAPAAALSLPDQHLLAGSHFAEVQPGRASISGETRQAGASIAEEVADQHPGAPAMITGGNPGEPAMINGDISEKDIFGETL